MNPGKQHKQNINTETVPTKCQTIFLLYTISAQFSLLFEQCFIFRWAWESNWIYDIFFFLFYLIFALYYFAFLKIRTKKSFTSEIEILRKNVALFDSIFIIENKIVYATTTRYFCSTNSSLFFRCFVLVFLFLCFLFFVIVSKINRVLQQLLCENAWN